MKYQALVRVARAGLSLCHGSVVLERGFSRSTQLMTSMQAHTEERFLNAKALVAVALRNYENQTKLLPITEKLLFLARSARTGY